MKMRKITSSLLALFMVISLAGLAACGGSQSGSQDGSQSGSQNVSQDSGQGTSASPTGSEPIVLRAITAFPDGDPATRSLEYFCDIVEERSNGSITFERIFGGTFCSMPEEFDYISSGAADVHLLLDATAIEKISLWSLANQAYEIQGTADLFNYIYFENEETARYAEAQAAASNVKILGALSGGYTLHFAKTPIKNFEDLRGTLYACERGVEIFNALGLNVQAIALGDQYEAISRGLANAGGISISMVIALRLHELVGYGLLSSTSNAAPYFNMNLTTYNNLSAEQRRIIDDSVRDAILYNFGLAEETLAYCLGELEAENVELAYFSYEDDMEYLQVAFDVNRTSIRPIAEATGYVEGFDAIVRAIGDYLGYELD